MSGVGDVPDALIGKTGFVGTTLLRQRGFAAGFNRTNIAEAQGQEFGTVICAAAPGSMFEANRFPEADTAAVDALIGHLSRLSARRFVLISTIAVLADFAGGDDEGTQAFQQELAYGRNRRRLEVFCQNQFETCLILRLPALFGEGLKKNFLFDMAHPIPTMLTEARLEQALGDLSPDLHEGFAALYTLDPALGLLVVDRARADCISTRERIEADLIAAGHSALGFTHPQSRFQYYDMRDLNTDIERAQAAGLDLLHLAPEPVEAGTVYRHVTGRNMPPNEARMHREDMRTRHAGLWDRAGVYSADAAKVLGGVGAFFGQWARV